MLEPQAAATEDKIRRCGEDHMQIELLRRSRGGDRDEAVVIGIHLTINGIAAGCATAASAAGLDVSSILSYYSDVPPFEALPLFSLPSERTPTPTGFRWDDR